MDQYLGVFKILPANPIQITVTSGGPGKLKFKLDNGPGTPDVAPPVEATESKPGSFDSPWGSFVYSERGRKMLQNGDTAWINFEKEWADPNEAKFAGVFKNLPNQSPLTVSVISPGKLHMRLQAVAGGPDMAPPIEVFLTTDRTYAGAWGAFKFSEDGRSMQQNGEATWVDESKTAAPLGEREARASILLPEGGGADVKWYTSISMNADEFAGNKRQLRMPRRKMARPLHYEFSGRSEDVVCNRGFLAVADLGGAVFEPLSQRVATTLTYPDPFLEWALITGETLCQRADELVQVLAPCQKLPEPTLPTGCTFQLNVKIAHVSFCAHLSQMKTLVPGESIIFSAEPAVLKKNFEDARTQFNMGQMWLRALLDIGEHPMTTHAASYMHVLAGMVDLLGRAYATGKIPDDAATVATKPPPYNGRVPDAETEAWLQGLECKPKRLSAAMRAWGEELAFITCNAAHAIRNALRIWGCMVEPNYDGGSGKQNDNGGCADGASMGGITGELLQHFVSADNEFGTVEGEMRNLVELLRTSPNKPHPNLDAGRKTTVQQQFEQARTVFGGAQGHARYMADVGLNPQTLNVYDLIRVQEDAFRALGRAIFTGEPAEFPECVLQFSTALAYDRLTSGEARMLEDIEQKLVSVRNFRSPDFYHLTPTEVSGLCRLNCDLGHFIQGVTQRNMLTDGTGAQLYLQGINGDAGNIEAVSRKIMCLVAPEKEQAMWPFTAYLTQVVGLHLLIEGITTKLKLACEQTGRSGMTGVPEKVGFGDTGVIDNKASHIQKAVDQLNRISKCLVNGMRRTPNTEMSKASKVRPIMLQTSQGNFLDAIDPVLLDQLKRTEEAAPGSVRNNEHLAPFVAHLNSAQAPVNGVHHRIQPGSKFQKQDRGSGKFALFNPASGQYLRATGAAAGGWTSDKAPENPDALQHSHAGNNNILMWETEQPDGTFSYMTFHGSYITVDDTKDRRERTGLTYDRRPDNFKIVQPDFKPFWAHWKGLATGQYILGAHIVIE